MAKTIVELDELNKRIYFDVDAGSETVRTVKEIGSLIKQELQLSPHIDQDKIFVWSGDEEFITNNRTGVVLTMQDSWTLWTRDQGAKHRFRITQGLILDSGGGDPLGTPTNIVWSLAEQSVSNITSVGGTSPTQQQIRDALALSTGQTINAGSIDDKLDEIMAMAFNEQEWVTPGVLKIYDNNGISGGTTLYEFETRDNANVQTFVLGDVRKYIRIK